jgi:hypothetical protein
VFRHHERLLGEYSQPADYILPDNIQNATRPLFYDNESHYSNVAMRQVYETSLLEASFRDIFWDIDGDLDRIQRARVDEEDHGVFQQRAMYAVAEGQKLVDDGIYVEPTRVTAELG